MCYVAAYPKLASPRRAAAEKESSSIGSFQTAVVELTGHLIGDNLPEPIPCSLEVQFQVEARPMERSDVSPYLQQ